MKIMFCRGKNKKGKVIWVDISPCSGGIESPSRKAVVDVLTQLTLGTMRSTPCESGLLVANQRTSGVVNQAYEVTGLKSSSTRTIEITNEELEEIRKLADDYKRLWQDESYLHHLAYYLIDLMKKKGVIDE